MTTPQKGQRIFISYRRADSQFAAGRIYDRLAAHYGEEAIFMDVEAIDGGADFVKVLEEAVQSCDVVLALIGRLWMNIKDERDERRLDNSDDFVRVEIAAALNREIRVIPVLVEHAIMPRASELPENLKPLARRNALHVNHQSFNADANRLIAHIERALQAAEDSRILKAKVAKEAQERAQRQAEIGKLFGQTDLAISSQDWHIAFEKISEILDLESIQVDTQGDWKMISENISAMLGLDSIHGNTRDLLDIVQRQISKVEEDRTEQARKEKEAHEKAKAEERAQLAAEQKAKKEREKKARKEKEAREKAEAEERARIVSGQKKAVGNVIKKERTTPRKKHLLKLKVNLQAYQLSKKPNTAGCLTLSVGLRYS